MILSDTNYWQCNRAANWPNWQRAFQQWASNSRQAILRRSGTDTQRRIGRQAHTHIHIQTHTHRHTHARGKQYESCGECAGLHFTGNQIKLAALHPPGACCCCWQTVSGCPCVFLSFWVTRLSWCCLCRCESYPWFCTMRTGSWPCAAPGIPLCAQQMISYRSLRTSHIPQVCTPPAWPCFLPYVHWIMDRHLDGVSSPVNVNELGM